MDGVFKRINLGLSNSGEQYLYYLLRAPAQERGDFERRRETVELFEKDQALRKKLHALLAGLGRRSNVNIFELFQAEWETTRKDLFAYLALALGLAASILLTVLLRNPAVLMLVFGLIAVNGALHSRRKGRDNWKFNTVQYCAAIERCVPNSVELKTSVLLTGSNASGKTTFLRALAVNLILAQGICTAHTEEFRCGAFRVLSSIDIQDNLSEGDSYYISELKSLRKIMKAADEPGMPVFCFLDEIFRGTNAVERIAASAEILTYLGRRSRCAAATHDLELCSILSPQFSLYHFAEQIADGEMLFDYLLKPGYSTTANAIRLLELMDFPAYVVERARHRASGYLARRDWNG